MWDSPFTTSDIELSMTSPILSDWFGESSKFESRMERYVHNMSRYLNVRFQSIYGIEDSYSRFRPHKKYISEVALTFKHLCGFSEEYRRSAWYWTTELEELREWQHVSDILEPLVRQSIKLPF